MEGKEERRERKMGWREREEDKKRRTMTWLHKVR